MSREQWFSEANDEMRHWIIDTGYGEDYEEPYISVGFPKGRRGKSGTAIGQCFDKRASGDKERAHIFISPTLKKAEEVLATLLHELIHASVGTKCGHRGAFRKCALAVGLEGKMTSTVPGKALKRRLNDLADRLGDYPHPGLRLPHAGAKGARL